VKTFPTDHICNVVLVGHGGTGKTSLTEALLLAAGTINRAGRVEEGNTVSDFDPDEIETLLQRAEADQVPLDTQLLGFTAGQRMKRAMVRLEASAAGDPSANGALTTALLIAETIHKMPFEVNLWQAQNIWNDLLRRSDTNYWTAEWKEDFKKLGKVMNICVDQLVIEEGVSAF